MDGLDHIVLPKGMGPTSKREWGELLEVLGYIVVNSQLYGIVVHNNGINAHSTHPTVDPQVTNNANKQSVSIKYMQKFQKIQVSV